MMGLGKIVNEITRRTPVVGSIRAYTVIVERYVKPPMKKVYMDQRKVNLKPVHYHYKLVDVLHKKKWGNVDLMLTEYVEGVGHKGEIVNVPRHLAYYELLPSRLAVYPTDEYLEMFKKDRAEIVNKPKVSPYAMKAKEEIEKITLDVPMNLNAEWQLTVENIRIALRYNKIMALNENIQIPAGLNVNHKNYSDFKDGFIINLKINDYVNANLKCRIVPVNTVKLWEEFAIFNKTI